MPLKNKSLLPNNSLLTELPTLLDSKLKLMLKTLHMKKTPEFITTWLLNSIKNKTPALKPWKLSKELPSLTTLETECLWIELLTPTTVIKSLLVPEHSISQLMPPPLTEFDSDFI